MNTSTKTYAYFKTAAITMDTQVPETTKWLMVTNVPRHFSVLHRTDFPTHVETFRGVPLI